MWQYKSERLVGSRANGEGRSAHMSLLVKVGGWRTESLGQGGNMALGRSVRGEVKILKIDFTGEKQR